MCDLVLQPGIEPGPPALEAWSLCHWAIGEAPRGLFTRIFSQDFPQEPPPRPFYWKEGNLIFLISSFFFLIEVQLIYNVMLKGNLEGIYIHSDSVLFHS